MPPGDRFLQAVFISIFLGFPVVFGGLCAIIVLPTLHPLLSLKSVLWLLINVIVASLLGFFVSLLVAAIIAFLFFGTRNKHEQDSEETDREEPGVSGTPPSPSS